MLRLAGAMSAAAAGAGAAAKHLLVGPCCLWLPAHLFLFFFLEMTPLPCLLCLLCPAGAVPDDCTERVLALAFGSHPALAADVVAEARQIQQQRRREQQQQQQQQQRARQAAAQPGADAAAGGEAGLAGDPSSPLQQGQQGQASGGQSGGPGASPYRLHQHRQAPLEMGHVSQRSQTRNRPLGLLLDGRRGTGSTDADSDCDIGPELSAAAEQEERWLQLRQLLLLDLHGSSQAAARMVLLRRLEALVLQAPELVAEVARLEAQWHQQRHWRQQHRLLRRQKGREASALLAGLAAGGGMDSSSGGSGRGRASSGRPGEKQRRQGGAQQWPALGQQWDSPQLQQGDEAEGDESSSGEDGEEEEEAEGPAGLQQLQQQRGQPGQQRRRVAQFRPPAFCVVTGRGRHSEAYRGGVLKAAVQEMLLLQGLPARSDPTNAGAVRWRALLPAGMHAILLLAQLLSSKQNFAGLLP